MPQKSGLLIRTGWWKCPSWRQSSQCREAQPDHSRRQPRNSPCQHAGINQGTNGLMGQIGVDGTGPVPQQGGKMMDLLGSPLSSIRATLVRFLVLTRYCCRADTASREGWVRGSHQYPGLRVDDSGTVLASPVRLQNRRSMAFPGSILIVGNGNYLHFEPRLLHVLNFK